MSLVSDRVLQLCTSNVSVLAALEADPDAEPRKIVHKLFRLRKRDRVRDSLPARNRSLSNVSVVSQTSEASSATSSSPLGMSQSLPSGVPLPVEEGLLSPGRLSSLPNHSSSPLPSPRIPASIASSYRGSVRSSPLSPSANTTHPTTPSTAHSRARSGSSVFSKASSAAASIFAAEITAEDLDRAAQCGRFSSRPSDLFLKVSAILAPRQGIYTPARRSSWASCGPWTRTRSRTWCHPV
jgi:hypothetical protein